MMGLRDTMIRGLKALAVCLPCDGSAILRRNLFLVMEYLPGGDFMSLLECIVQLEEQVGHPILLVLVVWTHDDLVTT
jgi:hypothetical protein